MSLEINYVRIPNSGRIKGADVKYQHPFPVPNAIGNPMAFLLSIKYTENCIERGEKSKVFLHVGNANQVSIGFPTWRSKWAQN